MNCGEKRFWKDLRIGYYVSGPGGAQNPRVIREGEWYLELVTVGAVWDLSSDLLCGPGWVFSHRAGQQTIFRSPAERHYECLTISLELETGRNPPDWPRAFCWYEAENAAKFAQEMLFAFHHTSVNREILCDLILAQFRFRLYQFRRKRERETIPDSISRALRHMDVHYMQALSLRNLAEQAGLSASHFQALFRKHMRISPHQYLIQQRMRAARLQLVSTLDPIKVVAAEVGYADTETFCRAFKQYSGCTALAFRHQYRMHAS